MLLYHLLLQPVQQHLVLIVLGLIGVEVRQVLWSTYATTVSPKKQLLHVAARIVSPVLIVLPPREEFVWEMDATYHTYAVLNHPIGQHFLAILTLVLAS